LQNPAGFRTFPTGPTAAVTHNGAFFNGGDPTLERPISCPKDGEYLTTTEDLICPLIFAGTQLPCKFVPGFLEKASFLASSCQVF
jgi:hypothetical protein